MRTLTNSVDLDGVPQNDADVSYVSVLTNSMDLDGVRMMMMTPM